MGDRHDRHRLVVLRHAKAGELPGGPDFERALLPGGQRDSAATGSWLASHGFRPDTVVCSSPRRTPPTWGKFAPARGGGPEFIPKERAYAPDAEDLIPITRHTPPPVGALLHTRHH